MTSGKPLLPYTDQGYSGETHKREDFHDVTANAAMRLHTAYNRTSKRTKRSRHEDDEERLAEIKEEIIQCSYRFTRPRPHRFDKGNGKYRTTWQPAFWDQVVQTALNKAISEIVEESEVLPEGSIAGRPGKKGTPELVRNLLEVANTYDDPATLIMAKLDLKEAFDTIGHREIHKSLTKLFEREFATWVMRISKAAGMKSQGVPQGVPTSPLLFNIGTAAILNRIGRYDPQGFQYFDDFTLIADSRKRLAKGVRKVEATAQKLEMKLNRAKTEDGEVGEMALFGFKLYTSEVSGIPALTATIDEGVSARVLRKTKEKLYAADSAGKAKTELWQCFRGWVSHYGDPVPLDEAEDKIRRWMRPAIRASRWSSAQVEPEHWHL